MDVFRIRSCLLSIFILSIFCSLHGVETRNAFDKRQANNVTLLYNSSIGLITDAAAPSLIIEHESSSTLVFVTSLQPNATVFVALVNRTTGSFLHNITLQGNNSRGADIIIHNQDLYLVGQTQANTFEGRNVPGSQGAFVTKLYINTNSSSPYLQKLWTVVFGGLTSDTSASSVAMQGSDIIVLGNTNGQTLDGVVSNQTGPINRLFLRKMDSAGNWVWTVFINGGSATSRSVVVDSQNNIYITALTTSGGYSGIDFLLMKTTSQGNVTWCQKIGSPSLDDDVLDILLQEDYGWIVLLAYGDYSSVKDSSGTILTDGLGLTDGLLLKYSMSQGQLQHGTYFGTADADYGLSLSLNSANNLVVLWHTDQTNTYSISKYAPDSLTSIYNFTFFPSPYLDGSIATETNRQGYFYVAGLSSAPVSPPTTAIFAFYDGYPDVTASPSPTPSQSAVPSSVSSFSSSPQPSTTDNSGSNDGKNVAIIAGCVGGIGGFLLVTAAVGFFLVRRKRSRDPPVTDIHMSEKKSSNIYSNIPAPETYHDSPTTVTPIPTKSENSPSNNYATMHPKDSKPSHYYSNSLTLAAEEKPKKTAHSDSPKFSGWEIDFNEIQIIRELGRGAFGVVYLCRWRNTDCVTKQLDFSKMDDQFVYRFLQEAENVKSLKPHPNVCTVFGACTDRRYPICIVMEYLPDGNLQDLIYEKKIPMNVDRLVSFAKDVASGMSHLHAENILHCDLACRNLLVAAKGFDKYQIKIADFGLSRILESETYTVSQQATFPTRWTAPETFQTGKISRACDVWSFGIVMWEMMAGKRPYMELSNPEVIEKVTSGYRLPRPAMQIPDSLWNLILGCWDADPTKRPSFNDIYQHLSKLEEDINKVQNVN